MNVKSALLALLLLLAVVTVPVLSEDEDVEVEDDDYSDPEYAFVLARKYFESGDVIVGKKTKVIIELHNAGTSSAADIEVTDTPMSSDIFEVAEGETSFSLKRLAAGSVSRHEYYIIPKSSGHFNAPYAIVKYRVDADSKKIQTTTSTSPHLLIITSFQKILKRATFLGTYVSLGLIRTPEQWQQWGLFVAVTTIALGGYFSYQHVTKTKNAYKYKKALEEVEKMR